MQITKHSSLPAGWKVRVRLSATGRYTVRLLRQRHLRMELICGKSAVAAAVWECVAWAAQVQADQKIWQALS